MDKTATELVRLVKEGLKSSVKELQAEPPVHPIFMSCLICLGYFVKHDLRRAPIDVVLVPMLSTVLAAFVFWALLALILRDHEKAGLVTTAAVLIFYGLIVLEPFAAAVPDFSLVEPFWCLLIVAITAVLMIKRGWLRASTVLNAATSSGCLFLAAIMISWEARTYFLTVPQFVCTDLAVDREAPKAVAEKPDIYYIIIDACASDNVLKTLYSSDQSGYSKALENIGFRVIGGSHSNYGIAMHSLASSLNMQYINQLTQIVGEKEYDFSVNNVIVRQNRVSAMLKRRGYKTVNISSGFAGTWWNPWANYNLHCGYFNECSFAILQHSLYGTFFCRSLVDELAQLRLCGFRQLKASLDLPGPKFVFAHILLPHRPYLFSPDGIRLNVPAAISFRSDNGEGEREIYAGQAEFAKKSAIDAIQYILKNSKKPPIIILQSDNGPATYGDITAQPNDTAIKERFGIYNAIYLPGQEARLLPSDLTPVNTFRIIFNKYFGTDYPLLPNRIFASSDATPFDFVDVTEKVKLD